MEQKFRLSVLDQTPIRGNASAASALQETIQLARLADRFHSYQLLANLFELTPREIPTFTHEADNPPPGPHNSTNSFRTTTP